MKSGTNIIYIVIVMNSSIVMKNDFMNEILKIKYTKRQQSIRRKDIYDKLSGGSVVDLYELFEAVDKAYFKNKLHKEMLKKGIVLELNDDKKCTRVAGKCLTWRSPHTSEAFAVQIKISKKVLEKIGQNPSCGGIKCSDNLSCLILVFQHELTHAIVSIFGTVENASTNQGKGNWTGKTNKKTQHSKTFMTVLNNIFGDLHYGHNLFHDDCPKGTRVTFKTQTGLRTGIVRTNGLVNAKVLTEDGYIWIVPHEWLKRA
jgi:hypothetical protein